MFFVLSTAAFNMRRRVVFAVFYVLVWVLVVFFNEFYPVPRLVRERKKHMIEQHFSLTLCAERHEKDR